MRVNQNGNTRTVNIEVVPLRNLRERCYLILFEEAERLETGVARHRGELKSKISRRSSKKQESRRADELERELSETRDYLQSIQEQHEAANEELQASNEEVQSANEELQSINEELETSKEELESTNEELTTVNEEMANRNAELNRLNSDLTNLQTSTKLAIVLLRRDLTIRRFSAQAERQFNLLTTDVGRPITNVRHNLDLPDLEELIGEVISNVRESEREVRGTGGRWFSLRVRPYLTLDNKVDGAVLVLVDVDDLKRKEREVTVAREYAESIVRTVRDPLLVLDSELRVQTANEAFYKTFDVSREQSEGRLIYDLGNGQWNIPKLRDLLENILPSKSVFNDFEVAHDFETIGHRTMLLNARMLDEGEGLPARILLGVRDVTERKQGELERANLLASEHEARKEAETANRIKDEFLATISHELRTPLNAILGWSQMLMRGTLDEETSARGLETIARNASAQNQLISDLLDVSRIISGQLRCEMGAVELIPVIDAAAEAERPAADAKGVELRLTLDPKAGLVSGDAIRLQQIVSNLLTNAVKFTPRNGCVNVQLKRQDASVVIIISDTGEGISPEFLPYIFDRFRQAAGSSSRQHGGLGLGLAIVQHLVELHGGSVRAASEGIGKGATFTVSVPLIVASRYGRYAERARTRERSAEETSSLILKGTRVLVVDDEADARELLTIALTQGGAEVRTSTTAREALGALDQWKPDILVSDIGMPSEDGYELIRKVRALEPERGGTIPAIALTGYASEEDAARARVAGYELHLPKPVSPGELVSKVASLVMKAR